MATKAQVRLVADNGQHDAPEDNETPVSLDATPETHMVDGVEHVMRGFDDLDDRRYYRFGALSTRFSAVQDNMRTINLDDDDDMGDGEFADEFAAVSCALVRMALPTVPRERVATMHGFERMLIVGAFLQHINARAEGKPGAQLLRPTQTA